MSYPECWNPRCGHPAETHRITHEDDLPDVLCSAPCTIEGCSCDDFDGPLHPERPSLADVELSRDDDGLIQVTVPFTKSGYIRYADPDPQEPNP